jgi:hypothetical protein
MASLNISSISPYLSKKVPSSMVQYHNRFHMDSILTQIMTFLKQQNRTTIITTGLVLVVILGVLDCVSGYEISFSILYLAPITLVTWFTERQWGYAVASISALVWLGADIMSGHGFTHPLIPFWNALMRLGFFFIVVTLLARLRLSYEEQTRIARELRESLEKVKVLSGLIPICAWCKNVRNDKGYWQRVEEYITENSQASFTHGICEECQARQLQGLHQQKR